MSYILTLQHRPQGVFSVIDKTTGEHIVPIFDELDDCERYALLLVESGKDIDLQLVEIDKDALVNACEDTNQRYAIITIDDFIIPPDD